MFDFSLFINYLITVVCVFIQFTLGKSVSQLEFMIKFMIQGGREQRVIRVQV